VRNKIIAQKLKKLNTIKEEKRREKKRLKLNDKKVSK
jgi:hypothetical protein